MKLAVLADVHANFAALEAVAAQLEKWRPDWVIVAGDLVNRGPRPLECLRFVQDKMRTAGWLSVLGNHEEYVMSHAHPEAPRSGMQFDLRSTSYWTYQQLNGDVSALAAMPLQQSCLAPDGSEFRVVHASMSGTRAGVYTYTSDDVLRRLIDPPPALLCVGHTHKPLIRRVDRTLVVNVGAVGLPFDGDQRASYGQLTWRANAWQAEIIRLEYDRKRADRDFDLTGFMDQSGAFAPLIRKELHLAQSQLYEWGQQYEAPVLAGELTLTESVRRFLIDDGRASA